MERGYYWVRLKGATDFTVGSYLPEQCDNGPIDKFPWLVVGDDSPIRADAIEEVGPRIKLSQEIGKEDVD